MALEPTDLALLDALLTGDIDWVPIMQPVLVGQATLEETLSKVESTLEKGCHSGRISAEELEVIRRRHAEMMIVDSSQEVLEGKFASGAITASEFDNIAAVNARLADASSDLHQVVNGDPVAADFPPPPQISQQQQQQQGHATDGSGETSVGPLADSSSTSDGNNDDGTNKKPHTYTGLYLRHRLSSTVASFLYKEKISSSSSVTMTTDAPQKTLADDDAAATAAAASSQRPPPSPPPAECEAKWRVTRSNVLNVQFASWYPLFKDVSIKSEVVPLPSHFVEWLRSGGDGMSLPPSTPTSLFVASSLRNNEDDSDDDDEEWGSGDDEEQQRPTEAATHFPPNATTTTTTTKKTTPSTTTFDFRYLDHLVVEAIERLHGASKKKSNKGAASGGFFFPKLNWSAPQV